jgi:hypothetical protein
MKNGQKSLLIAWIFWVVAFCAVFIGHIFADTGSEEFAKEAPAEEEARMLEKRILELEDANAMLMQNVVGCMEENEALRARLKAATKEKGDD